MKDEDVEFTRVFDFQISVRRSLIKGCGNQKENSAGSPRSSPSVERAKWITSRMKRGACGTMGLILKDFLSETVRKILLCDWRT